MANSLNFILNLADRMSGPGRNIHQALDRIDRTASRAGASVDTAGRLMERSLRVPEPAAFALTMALKAIAPAAASIYTVARAATSLGDVLTNTKNRAQSLTASVGVIRRTVGAVDSAVFSLRSAVTAGAVGLTGKMVLDAVRFKEDTLTAFTVMAGGRKQGEQIFRQAVKFAADTPFSTTQVMDAYQNLLAFEFKPVEVPIVMKGIGDMAALKGFSQETINRLTLVFGQIRAKGKLQGEEMQQLAEAGIGRGQVFDIIGKKIGKTRNEVEKLVSAGQVSSNLGLFGILKAIEKTTGGKLGTMMERMSKTITGMLSTLGGRFTEFFMDLDTSPAIRTLKSFLGALVAVTETGSGVGLKLKNALQRSFGAIFGVIVGSMGGGDVGQKVTAFVNRIADGLIWFTGWVKINGPTIKAQVISFGKGIIDGLGTAFATAKVIWSAVKPTFEAIGSVIDRMFGRKSGGGAARLIGMIVGMVVGFNLLNIATFGILGAFLGFGFTVIRLVSFLMLLNRLTGGAVFAAFGKLLPVFGFIGRAIGSVIMGLIRLGASWLIGMGPIGWIIIGVMAIGAALVAAYNYFPWFRDGVDAVFDWILVKWFDFLGWFRALPGEFSSIGSAIVQGLTDGIYAMGDLLTGVGDWIYNNTVGAAKAKLGIHSPSRVFAWMGQMMSLGMAQGITSGGSGVTSAVGALGTAAVVGLAPAAVAAPTGQAGGFGGAPQITVQITLQSPGGSSPGQSAAVTEQIRAATREGILEAFEQLAMEGGYGG